MTRKIAKVSAAATVSPLQAHLGYWLRFVSNHVSQAFDRKLAAHDVAVAEWVMMRELFDEPAMTPSVLAERMGMTRGAISKLADRLAAKALIVRTASEDDRRFQSLALTSAGRKLTPVLAALADKNDEEYFGRLAPSVRATIEAAMKEIVRRQDWRTAPIE